MKMEIKIKEDLKIIIDAIQKSVQSISKLLQSYVPSSYIKTITNKSGDLVSQVDMLSNEIVKNNSPIKFNSSNANHQYNKGYKHFGGVWFKQAKGIK